MEFRHPGIFLILPVVIPYLFYCFYSRKKTGTLVFSAVSIMKDLPVSFRQRSRIILPILLSLTVILLVTALARPRSGKEVVDVKTKGIALMMVFDRSGSMAETMDGEKSRMEVSKDVFRRFVIGDSGMDLGGRPSDLIGLVTFASFPTVMCPLTLSHESLVARTENLDAITPDSYGRLAREFGSTAIGDALKLAVAKLTTAEQRMKKEDAGYEIKSKMIILLTDGESNTGSDPVKAAEFAAEKGIKVYSIGIGQSGARRTGDAFGGFFITSFGRRGADMETLKKISDKTGGFARQANDEASLAEIYREIDKAEKTEIETRQYMQYDEQYAGFLLAAVVLYCLFLLLENTLLRRVP